MSGVGNPAGAAGAARRQLQVSQAGRAKLEILKYYTEQLGLITFYIEIVVFNSNRDCVIVRFYATTVYNDVRNQVISDRESLNMSQAPQPIYLPETDYSKPYSMRKILPNV